MARIRPEIQDFHRANGHRLRAAAQQAAWDFVWRLVQKCLARRSLP